MFKIVCAAYAVLVCIYSPHAVCGVPDAPPAPPEPPSAPALINPTGMISGTIITSKPKKTPAPQGSSTSIEEELKKRGRWSPNKDVGIDTSHHIKLLTELNMELAELAQASHHASPIPPEPPIQYDAYGIPVAPPPPPSTPETTHTGPKNSDSAKKRSDEIAKEQSQKTNSNVMAELSKKLAGRRKNIVEDPEEFSADAQKKIDTILKKLTAPIVGRVGQLPSFAYQGLTDELKIKNKLSTISKAVEDLIANATALPATGQQNSNKNLSDDKDVIEHTKKLQQALKQYQEIVESLNELDHLQAAHTMSKTVEEKIKPIIELLGTHNAQLKNFIEQYNIRAEAINKTFKLKEKAEFTAIALPDYLKKLTPQKTPQTTAPRFTAPKKSQTAL